MQVDPSHPLPPEHLPVCPQQPSLLLPGETDETKKFASNVLPVLNMLHRMDIDESMININPNTGLKKCWGNCYLVVFSQYPSIVYFYVGFFPAVIFRSNLNLYLNVRCSTYPINYTYFVDSLKETLTFHLDHSSLPRVGGNSLARVCTVEEAQKALSNVAYFLIPCAVLVEGPIMRTDVSKWGEEEGDLEEMNAQDVIQILETRLSKSVDLNKDLKEEMSVVLSFHRRSVKTLETDIESVCTHWYWDLRKFMGTLELPWVAEMHRKFPAASLKDILKKLMNRVEKESYDAQKVRGQIKEVTEEVKIISQECRAMKKELEYLCKQEERRIPEIPPPLGVGLTQLEGGHGFPKEGEDLEFLERIKLHSEHLRACSTFVNVSDEFMNKVLSKTFEEKDAAYLRKANMMMNKMSAMIMQFEEEMEGGAELDQMKEDMASLSRRIPSTPLVSRSDSMTISTKQSRKPKRYGKKSS